MQLTLLKVFLFLRTEGLNIALFFVSKVVINSHAVVRSQKLFSNIYTEIIYFKKKYDKHHLSASSDCITYFSGFLENV